jgi:hypothetical protein
LSFAAPASGDNRSVRRRLLLAGIWLIGASIAVTFSFAAVGRVASGVSPSNGPALSSRAVDNALTSDTTGRRGSRPPSVPTSSVPRSTAPATTTQLNAPAATASPSWTMATPTTVPAPRPSPPPPPPSSGGHETVTTSQGGTIWTRCSGPDSIVYVAAIPKSGYQRTVDVESATGIDQEFQNGSRRSKIQAACSNGVVRAEVEEEGADN